jgi:hypothetical protein
MKYPLDFAPGYGGSIKKFDVKVLTREFARGVRSS